MADDQVVVVLGTWASPFSNRVRIALLEKGVEHEYKEEDLLNKSSLLLKSNPVYKKIPVLLHNNRPICESLNILQYIDQTWNRTSVPSLMPGDPFQRANARFWGDFIDKKIYDCGTRIWKKNKGEGREDAKRELIDCLKALEGELGQKQYFGGESFGYVDMAFIPIASRFYAFEKYGDFSVEEECPKLMAWVRRCMERESVSKVLPEPHKIYEHIQVLKKRLGIE